MVDFNFWHIRMLKVNSHTSEDPKMFDDESWRFEGLEK